MAELEKIAKKDMGKSSYEMRHFFQQMVEREEIKAFSIEIGKQKIELNKENKKIVKIKKGATLTRIRKLEEYRPFMLKDPKMGSMYALHLGSRMGKFYNEGNSQTIYHHCLLERLVKGFSLKKVKKEGINNGISVPGETVTARLRICYDENWESNENGDRVTGVSGSIVVEGEQDDLLKKVYEFVTRDFM